MKTCRQLRKEFIAFFEQQNHTFVPSSSLLPTNDPTLLFANAGMNQFKDIFLGRETRNYVRAANTQKCIRAGGKHNDLEDVGLDCYHHTFFEMLGNWSFGDYFKKDAIAWAWKLLTEVWGLPKERLHVTVFEGDKSEGLDPDTQAENLWKEMTDIDPAHIHKGNKKDNFWEMGATGPCGPCSEIHYDGTPDRSGGSRVNADDPNVIEIWNLVFMQFNRGEDGKLTPLPATHVDTGMGLERLGRILQGKKSNYATDLFVPIIEAIEKLTDYRYGSSAEKGEDRFDTSDMKNLGDIACRVIADHTRTLTFALTDGIIPSNEGRGYVIRRILRRAARYGRQYLNIEGPFLAKLVDTVIELMGDFFSELKNRRDYVVETIREEEDSFGKTLDRGIALFQRQAEKLRSSQKTQLPGEVAFDLYTTYGFPVDLTELMAEEAGLTVDIQGYEDAMAHHRELSGSGEQFRSVSIANLPATDDSAKYSQEPIAAKVLGWVVDHVFADQGQLSSGQQTALVLDRTNFYGEQGGQVGDTGELCAEGVRFIVRDTQVAGQCVLHLGILESGTLIPGQTITAKVNPARFDTMRNHTATHLLNHALREVLGNHINQAGSVVSPDRLRFDFTHNQAVTAEQLTEVEKLVNQRILADETVTATLMPLAKAQKIPGVRAMFGEKYPDPVRVISMGNKENSQANSIEFCGGSHLSHTSQAGLFKIVSEESVAKGVRRITAITGPEAVKQVQENDRILHEIALAMRASSAELPERIAAMQKEIKQLRKRPAAAASGEFRPEETLETPHGKVLIGNSPVSDADAMRNICDVQRQKGASAIFLAGEDDGKAILVAMVSEEMVKACSLKAGDWVKIAAAVVGGGGGGKPTLAQAGGKQPEKLPEALKAATEFARKATGM